MNKLKNKLWDIGLWFYWYVIDTIKLIEKNKELEKELEAKIGIALEQYTIKEMKKNNQL